MRYRPHRGGLAEAMAEAVDVDGFDGLVAHMRATWGGAVNLAAEDPATLIAKRQGDDDRIGWKDVHIVKWGDCIGYTEGDPRRAPAVME